MLGQGLEHCPGGVFTACGTGEFHALSSTEVAAVVATTVGTVAGAVPVFAGTGGPIAQAVEQAQAAAQAGADGILLLPPYLVQGPQDGLVDYVTQVAGATSLQVIVYHRGVSQFTEASASRIAALPTVVGLKDGAGDVDTMSRIVRTVRDSHPTEQDFQFFNGLPTAEATQRAYRSIGVPLYSSAAFAFAPAVALAFYRALEAGDDDTLARLEREFYHPLVRLRNTTPGYAVSLVKAGVARFTGVAAGSVRPPLVDPAPHHLAELDRVYAAGMAAAAESSSP
jgi:5-dehydro-4-deoxyglucarate dehydratase